MPQKKYALEGTPRPIELSPAQAEALATGESLTGLKMFEGHAEQARPRDLTDEDVATLSAGKELNLEAMASVEDLQDTQPRPLDLTDEDVKTLAAGKELNLAKRRPLKANYGR